ncbi:hypothetical protein LTR78_004106 [Recurvomyces mirabilis]|uniref:Uncharacterized protein n=1 Tax=Recurvomyces mirabilis TaxID=574656 RepID=A0AAE1C2V3_9PEZI|nr:hypothetical protein LTR78_004106 [Recurvomyces mirabilis]KAK5153721.1 hypothetical protein LTS14_007415 [Recurvomyces mirabilis]
MPRIASFSALLVRARSDTYSASPTRHHNPDRLEALLKVVYSGSDELLIKAFSDPQLSAAIELLRSIPIAELQAELGATRVYIEGARALPHSGTVTGRLCLPSHNTRTIRQILRLTLMLIFASVSTIPLLSETIRDMPMMMQIPPNKYYCPACRQPKTVKRNDAKRHMKDSCEVLRKMAFQTWFGCPYCHQVAAKSLEEYRLHLYDHVQEGAAPTPHAVIRLRNLTMQNQLVGPSTAELQRRTGRPDSWMELLWLADDVIPLTQILEIGQTFFGWPQTAQGYQNPVDFVNYLLSIATIGRQSLTAAINPMAVSGPSSTPGRQADRYPPLYLNAGQGTCDLDHQRYIDNMSEPRRTADSIPSTIPYPVPDFPTGTFTSNVALHGQRPSNNAHYLSNSMTGL